MLFCCMTVPILQSTDAAPVAASRCSGDDVNIAITRAR
jgi:hypothetical protein